jgi:hypothetical protein
MSITEDTARSEYVAGLRALADLLEGRPDLPLPLSETFAVFCDKDTAVAWVRALPGEKPKDVNSDEQYMLFGKRSMARSARSASRCGSSAARCARASSPARAR